MKLSVRNTTASPVYVAIANFDDISQMVDEPIVFKLEPQQQGWCETTSSYLFGGSSNGYIKYVTYVPINYNELELVPDQTSWNIDFKMSWNPTDHYDFNLTYSNDDTALRLKNRMLTHLCKQYKLYDSSLDLKVPAEE